MKNERACSISFQGRLSPRVVREFAPILTGALIEFDRKNGSSGPFVFVSMAGLTKAQSATVGNLVSDWLDLEFPA